MAEQLKWTFSVQVVNGTQLSGFDTIEVSAYDKITMTIAESSSEEIDVQPGGAGTVKFLVLKADIYENLTYKVNSDTADEIPLDAMQLFMGDGAVGLLDTSPNSLFVYNNNGDKTATIEILVGRDA